MSKITSKNRFFQDATNQHNNLGNIQVEPDKSGNSARSKGFFNQQIEDDIKEGFFLSSIKQSSPKKKIKSQNARNYFSKPMPNFLLGDEAEQKNEFPRLIKSTKYEKKKKVVQLDHSEERDIREKDIKSLSMKFSKHDKPSLLSDKENERNDHFFRISGELSSIREQDSNTDDIFFSNEKEIPFINIKETEKREEYESNNYPAGKHPIKFVEIHSEAQNGDEKIPTYKGQRLASWAIDDDYLASQSRYFVLSREGMEMARTHFGAVEQKRPDPSMFLPSK